MFVTLHINKIVYAIRPRAEFKVLSQSRKRRNAIFYDQIHFPRSNRIRIIICIKRGNRSAIKVSNRAQHRNHLNKAGIYVVRSAAHTRIYK